MQRYLEAMQRRGARAYDMLVHRRLAAVRELRNRHQGERAYLIGNGPSVAVGDLERLQGALTFCFNRFHLAYGEMDFRPSYTVMADTQIIEDFGSEIAREGSGDLVVASAYRPAHLATDFIWLPLKNLRPFEFNDSIDRMIAPGGSVLVVALQLAFYMGVRDVVLYGVDHHFDFESIPGDDQRVQGEGNHFIKDYRAGMSWYPPNPRQIDEALEVSKRHYERSRGSIRNATRGGKLEIFERAELDDLIRST